jgi:hypothetical protein
MRSLLPLLLLLVTSLSFAQGGVSLQNPEEKPGLPAVNDTQVHDEGDLTLDNDESPEEPIQVHFNTGKMIDFELLSATEQSDLIEQVVAAVGPGGVLKIEELEGETPMQIPAALAARVQIVREVVPLEVNSAFNQFLTSMGIIPPTAKEKFFATVFFSMRVGIGHAVAISHGVDPSLAWVMATSVGLVTFTNSAFGQTIARFWMNNARRFKNYLRLKLASHFEKGSQSWIRKTRTVLQRKYGINAGDRLVGSLIFTQSMAYDLTSASLLNLQGHLNTEKQTLANALYTSPPSNYLGTQKSILFEDFRERLVVYNFIPTSVFYTIQALMSTGAYNAPFRVWGYSLGLPGPILVSYSMYAVLIAANLIAPKKVVALTSKAYFKLDELIFKIRDQLNGTSRKFCNLLLHSRGGTPDPN